MFPLTRRQLLLFAGLAPTGKLAAQLIGHSGGEWSIRGTDPIEIYRGDRRVTAYHAGYGTGVPFFDPVVGPSGKSFTVAAATPEAPAVVAPTGLWFSLGNVNGYHFHPSSAAESSGGMKRGRILHKGMNGVLIKDSVIVIRMKSEWMEAASPGRRLCSDEREFTLFHRGDGSLAINAVIELMADAGDLEIGEEASGAWSLRVGAGLAWKEGDKNRRLSCSEGLEGKEVVGKRANWVICEGLDAGNVPGGVAVFDHPGNPGFPAQWTFDESGIISANPFAPRSLPAEASGIPSDGTTKEEPEAPGKAFRLRARSGKHDLPRIVRNGESIVFRYRTVFFTGKAEAAEIPAAYAHFAE
jgi:hypothetical protein